MFSLNLGSFFPVGNQVLTRTTETPSSCCGARWGEWKGNQVRPEHCQSRLANKGIHIWPTKVDVPEVFGVPWNVTLGGETLTVSIITNPNMEGEFGYYGTIHIPDSPISQHLISVHFDTCSERYIVAPPSGYTFEGYYGAPRSVFEGAFGKVLALLKKDTHLCFILADDQLKLFELCMKKYKPNVNRIEYPNKIVNRNYAEDSNPRLTMLFLTLKD